MLNRQLLKSESKELMRRGGGRVIKTVLLFLVITFVLAQLMALVEGSRAYEREYRELMNDAAKVDRSDPEAVQQYLTDLASSPTRLPERTLGANVIVLMLSLVSSILTTGFRWWSLRASRGDIGEPGSIFDVFSNFLRVLFLTLLRGLIISVGMILFVVPGIFAVLIYSQADYILFENPEAGAIDCLRRSRLLMSGHLGEYFLLVLSFLGWIFLAVFASGMISSVAFTAGLSMVTTNLIVICAYLIWLMPYMEFSFAGYYNYLTNYTPELPDEEVTE